jgi:hypothetical protein
MCEILPVDGAYRVAEHERDSCKVLNTKFDSIEAEQEKYGIETWKVNGKLEAYRQSMKRWTTWNIL